MILIIPPEDPTGSLLHVDRIEDPSLVDRQVLFAAGMRDAQTYGARRRDWGALECYMPCSGTGYAHWPLDGYFLVLSMSMACGKAKTRVRLNMQCLYLYPIWNRRAISPGIEPIHPDKHCLEAVVSTFPGPGTANSPCSASSCGMRIWNPKALAYI